MIIYPHQPVFDDYKMAKTYLKKHSLTRRRRIAAAAPVIARASDDDDIEFVVSFCFITVFYFIERLFNFKLKIETKVLRISITQLLRARVGVSRSRAQLTRLGLEERTTRLLIDCFESNY